jgi:hypothetical protein
MLLRIDPMRPQVVLKDLGHETRHGAARTGDEVHDLLATRFFSECAFYAVNLSPKSTNAGQQLFSIANRMAHSPDYSIPTHPIEKRWLRLASDGRSRTYLYSLSPQRQNMRSAWSRERPRIWLLICSDTTLPAW